MSFSVFYINNWPWLFVNKDNRSSNIQTALSIRLNEFNNSIDSKWRNRVNLCLEPNINLKIKDSSEYFLSIDLAKKKLPKDSTFFLFVAPNHQIPNLDLPSSWNTCVGVGDVHHTSNPLSFLYDSLIRIRPNNVIFISSILGGDVICRMLNLNYQLWPYTLRKTHHSYTSHDSIEPWGKVMLSGSLTSPFHPRRQIILNALATQSHFEVLHQKYEPFHQWVKSIKFDAIHSHISLNGNISTHPLLCLARNIPIIIDQDLFNNPYFHQVYASDPFCIPYTTIPDLIEATQALASTEFNNLISAHNIESFRTLMPRVEEIDSSISTHYPGCEFFDEIVRNTALKLDEFIKAIPLLLHRDLVVLLDCVQELIRVSYSKISISIFDNLYSESIEGLMIRYSRLEVFQQNKNTEADIVVLGPNAPKNLIQPEMKYTCVRETIGAEQIKKFARNRGTSCDIKAWPQKAPQHFLLFLKEKLLD